MLILYGINNCDRVRAARLWLKNSQQEYQFHDFRKQGVTLELITSLEVRIGWELMLSRRSKGWQQLSTLEQQQINSATAIALMLENPTTIKRPILINPTLVIIGFKTAEYQKKLCLMQP